LSCGAWIEVASFSSAHRAESMTNMIVAHKSILGSAVLSVLTCVNLWQITAKGTTMAPTLYRIILQVDNLDRAEEFYGTLLGDRGRRIPRGSRHYIDCGPVILGIVDVTGEGTLDVKPVPLPDYIYFSVNDLEAVHERARQLECLSTEDVHGASAAEIVKRPWGERSFYAYDPWGNGLCFVDENTLFTGK
jgi:predicted enzyme related to lactoylglutathione lyase